MYFGSLNVAQGTSALAFVMSYSCITSYFMRNYAIKYCRETSTLASFDQVVLLLGWTTSELTWLQVAAIAPEIVNMYIEKHRLAIDVAILC